MKKYIMALDAGTTSNRCIIFDHEGHMVSLAQKEFAQIFPKAGWVEQDGTEIWSTLLGVATEAMAKANLSGEDIAAIGITNQRETTLVWDRKTGQPVWNAIVWQCRRTADMTDKLIADGHSDTIRAKTGLLPDPYFSATKIRWILDHIPQGQARAEAGDLLFGTVDSWLIYNLTKGKVHATDYSNASRTMLYNIHNCEWDRELLDLLDIPSCILPEVKPSSGLFGYSHRNYFGAEIVVAGVAGDQQAALFGQTCFEKGEAKNTYGTGAFLLMNTGDRPVRSDKGLVSTIAWSLKPGQVTYALEGSIFVAGSAVQWLRDSLRIVDAAVDTEYMAGRVDDTAGCYVVPAFTGLGAPYWDPHARGTIVGMTRGISKYHIIRATLEAEAYLSNDVLQAMVSDSRTDLKLLKVDGGGSANNFLMQFQADISRVEVRRAPVLETTALGAAYLAGLAVGFWKDLDELKEMSRSADSFLPEMDPEDRGKRIRNWRRAVNHALGWARDLEE